MLHIGYFLAVTFSIPTEGADANIWYALSYMFLTILPVMGMTAMIGRKIWKRVAMTNYNEKSLDEFIDDKCWKRSGGD
jgi:NADH:ubiquinone oxidoreductase subunit 2 (subunit N)